VSVSFDPLTVAFFIVSLVPAMVLHEWSHGIVADRMGDMTPRLHGRLTLNPARHIDPFGTLVLPGLLLLPYLFGRGATPVFGYAKPMPLDPSNLKNPERQMIWIALMGPLTNLVLAVAGALVFRFLAGFAQPLDDFLLIFVVTNLLVAVFHIMPIPPLDGARVLAGFLPDRAREVFLRLEPYGALFMLLIFFLFPGPVFAIVLGIRDGLLNVLLG
jgi:Zn-dependent protease